MANFVYKSIIPTNDVSIIFEFGIFALVVMAIKEYVEHIFACIFRGNVVTWCKLSPRVLNSSPSPFSITDTSFDKPRKGILILKLEVFRS